MRMRRRHLLLGASALAAPRPVLAQPAALRVGALRFGSVHWVLDVIRQHRLAPEAMLRIETVELAGAPAAQVALQGGSLDLTVADWLWVARQRATGGDLTFMPFSTALGGVVVPPDSPVGALPDLVGLRLGVAGSPLDKSWLLLRLLALRRDRPDPGTELRPVFGAPPLLAELLANGRLDAVLTYWPFVARLQARGMRLALPMQDVLGSLGFPQPLPMLGWTFSAAWAKDHAPALQAFLRAVAGAMAILAASDAEWDRIAPLTGATGDAELAALRTAFRQGIPRRWDAGTRAEAARLYGMLARIGGPRLVGPARSLPAGTFCELELPPA